jgi:para-nitrobenzyl esterase
LLVAGASAWGADAADRGKTLAATSWQLVRYEDSAGTILKPKDPTKYTITFQKDGRLIARIDCNRGSGTWKTDGRLGLKLGPLALIKAKCPAGSLHDQIIGDWKHLQSYSMNKGHLLLLLKLDAGAYEFAPR